MAISIVGVGANSSGTGTSSNPSVTLPAGIQTGDVAVAVLVVNNTGSYAAPSGDWSAAPNSPLTQSTVLGVSCWVRTNLTSASSSTTITSTGGGAKWAFSVIVLRGARTTVDANANNTPSGTDSTTVTIPAITPVKADAFLVAAHGLRYLTGGTADYTQATNWTESTTAEIEGGTSGFPYTGTAIATRQLTGGAGVSTGTADATTGTNCRHGTFVVSWAPLIVPGAPTIGTATAGNAQASVAFTAPADNGGTAITGYTVTSSPGGLTGTGAASPITVSGLTNGTAYTFTVTATNSVGTGAASAASNSVTPATVPGAPTIGTATAGNAQATVAFTPPASDGGSAITGYTATSSPGSITGTGAGSPITVNGLTNGTGYTFTVTATNAIGTGAASAASNSVTPSGGSVGVLGDSFATTLNRLAGTTGLSSTDAANVWAGTSKLCLNDALNIKAGNSLPNYKALGGVCNQLAGTTDLSPTDALRQRTS